MHGNLLADDIQNRASTHKYYQTINIFKKSTNAVQTCAWDQLLMELNSSSRDAVLQQHSSKYSTLWMWSSAFILLFPVLCNKLWQYVLLNTFHQYFIRNTLSHCIFCATHTNWCSLFYAIHSCLVCSVYCIHNISFLITFHCSMQYIVFYVLQ